MMTMPCRSALVFLCAVGCGARSGGDPSETASPSTSPAAVVDSHVHLAYYAVADHLAANGVQAVVDLGAPETALAAKYPIRVIQSGPMLTRPGGYPLDSWGAAGYGVGCEDDDCIAQTIDRLRRRGARVIKLALDPGGLDPDLASFAVTYAHRRRFKVAAHALTDASARLAAEIDVDVLAHTPVEPLSPETLEAWRAATRRGPRAVITTLLAFGGSDQAIANLGALRDAGLIVLYGTDLGNLRVNSLSAEEIGLMRRAGLDQPAIDAALTTAPWQFWGFDSR
jgi:hypothetical protein